MPHLGDGRLIEPSPVANSLGTLTTMSDVDSPVLRLIPYLTGITVAIFVGLAMLGGGNALTALVSAAIAYFVSYYLIRYVIGFIVDRNRGSDSDDQA